MDLISDLVNQFGYVGISIALAAGIVGLPIPDELLMTYVGFRISQGEMVFILAFIASYLGSTIGITISYLIGTYLGLPFLLKAAPKLRISEKKISKTQELFQKFGPVFLFIGYFIPGVRHLTGVIAGISGMSFLRFSFFAYTGALIWVTLFLSIGNYLGEEWYKLQIYMHKYSLPILYVLLLISIIFFIAKFKKRMEM